MNEYPVTSLMVRSNLQPANDIPRYDQCFLEKIREPDAIRILFTSNITLTSLQNEIYHKTAPCAYAKNGDRSWGTIFDTNGNEKVVCKCLNINCEKFDDCRSDFPFSESEFELIRENEEKVIDNITKYEIPSFDNRTIEGNPIVEPKLTQEISQASSESIDIQSGSSIKNDADDNDVKPNENSRKVETPQNNNTGNTDFISITQEEVIAMGVSERAIINAGPGTGKTWTLIEKLKYMINRNKRQNIEPQNILVLCFSRSAVDVIQNRLREAADKKDIEDNWRDIEVRTFDSFSTRLLGWILDKHPEWLPGNFDLNANDYDSRIIWAKKIIRNYPYALGAAKHVFIDEVQDLVDSRAELVLELLCSLSQTCGFTILGDSCQAIYDYLSNIDNSIMTSQKFYATLEAKFPDIYRLAFIENHRQNPNFPLLHELEKYRISILKATDNDRKNIYSTIINNISQYELNLKKITSDDFTNIRHSGNLGILVRTNGLALYISTLLSNNGINHLLQKRSNENNFGRWLADIFYDYSNESITEYQFTDKFKNTIYSREGNDPHEYWIAAIEKADERGNHYYISDVLNSLQFHNPKNKLLFNNVNNFNDMTISTIHKAKGKEFDSVIIAAPENDSDYFENSDELQEHKVNYVSLTRAKYALNKITIPKIFIYIDKKYGNRCFMGFPRYGRKGTLTKIEIGLDEDINNESFCESEKTQNYIKNNLRINDKVSLILDMQSVKPVYLIIPENNPSITLGRTTEIFATGIRRAFMRIWQGRWNSPYINNDLEYYPSRFSDVYVDNLITCISSYNDRLFAAKRFATMALWTGFTLSGLAVKESDRF